MILSSEPAGHILALRRPQNGRHTHGMPTRRLDFLMDAGLGIQGAHRPHEGVEFARDLAALLVAVARGAQHGGDLRGRERWKGVVAES